MARAGIYEEKRYSMNQTLVKNLLLSTFLVAALDFSVEPSYATEQSSVDEHSAEIYQQTLSVGNCGGRASYSFNASTGTLTITGDGALYNFGYRESQLPWESYLDQIKTVVIGEGITHIGNKAFYDCTSLQSVSMPSTLKTIGNAAFMNCYALPTLIMPNSVTYAGWEAFSNCTSLVNLHISTSLEEIPSCGFLGCTSLRSVVIPDSVTSLAGSTFSNCSSLSSVTFPDTLLRFDMHDFTDCTSLRSVTLPDSVIEMGDCIFQGCTALTQVNIPNQLTYLPSCAFLDCTSLEEVVIPDSVTKIGQIVFSGCTALRSMTVPDSVTDIGWGMFRKCSSLSQVTLPENITTIGRLFFENCSSLTSITIPESITVISEKSFSNCDGITTVYYGGSQESHEAMFIHDTGNEPLQSAQWIYHSTGGAGNTGNSSAIPEWAKPYTSFVSTVIMPDISDSNYGEHASRGLIAQSLYNMLGEGKVSPAHGFSDAGSYDFAIAWCKEQSVMNGMDGTTFGTESSVTREQFALILMQASKVLEKSTVTGNASVLLGFQDVGLVSSWAETGIAWAVANGLMSGSEGNLNPSGQITRTEVSVMLYAFDRL